MSTDRLQEPGRRETSGDSGKQALSVAALIISILTLAASVAVFIVQRRDAAQALHLTTDQTDQALRLSREQAYSAARAEISGYVVQIAQLDKDGAEGSRNEIVTLAKQIDTLDQSYPDDVLLLSASTYRLTGQYLALATTELPLARAMALRGYELAVKPRPHTDADPLEAIQAKRVLGDIDAQDLDMTSMEADYRAALRLSTRYATSNRYVRREAPAFTRAYLAVGALMVAQAAPDPPCAKVRSLYREGRRSLETLGHSYDVLRRAKRVTDDPCDTGFDVRTTQERWDRLTG